jgi:hypothetical protein
MKHVTKELIKQTNKISTVKRRVMPPSEPQWPENNASIRHPLKQQQPHLFDCSITSSFGASGSVASA